MPGAVWVVGALAVVEVSPVGVCVGAEVVGVGLVGSPVGVGGLLVGGLVVGRGPPVVGSDDGGEGGSSVSEGEPLVDDGSLDAVVPLGEPLLLGAVGEVDALGVPLRPGWGPW
ncbi:hypothetical protein, partial [Streptomyces antimycoticus]|uniref:hypothetical protein n=1 Tax=Streptomyces antimycoticus TaxID=68175 RepID=UPI00191BC5CF